MCICTVNFVVDRNLFKIIFRHKRLGYEVFNLYFPKCTMYICVKNEINLIKFYRYLFQIRIIFINDDPNAYFVHGQYC